MSTVAPKLHAKVLVSERCAIIGSHNYVWQGVRFGTAEIAFITTNQPSYYPAQMQQWRTLSMSLSEMINQTNSQDIVLHDGLSYVDALTQSIAEKSPWRSNCCCYHEP